MLVLITSLLRKKGRGLEGRGCRSTGFRMVILINSWFTMMAPIKQTVRSPLLQVDAEKDIFEKKNDRETSFHKELLKDHVAHRHVLTNIARSKSDGAATGSRAESHLGHYGLGASKLEIQPLIDQRIKDNTCSAKRRKQSRKIQSKRREVKVFDRTMTTSALLRMKPEVKNDIIIIIRKCSAKDEA